MLIGLGSALLVSGATPAPAPVQPVVVDADAQSITVTANPLWTDTGIVLTETDGVTISDAAGSWTWGGGYEFGPDGNYQPTLVWDEWIPNGYHGQLIGIVLPDGLDPNTVPRILPQDDSRLFTIGSGTVTRNGDVGRLWLGFNDDYLCDCLWDNFGYVAVKVNVESTPSDEAAKPDTPETFPKLCAAVCKRAEEDKAKEGGEAENIRAACYSCRCRQIIGHPVTMDKAEETAEALTFDLKKTGKDTFEEKILTEPPRNPPQCVNPALLDDVDRDHSCAIGNRLGQASWDVKVDGTNRKAYAKWIWRKKGATDKYNYNDWGKIYYRDDGFTCNFDDVDREDDGRDANVLGERRVGGWDYDAQRHYPALDLTWVVEYWQNHPGMRDDKQRVAEIAKDGDITMWRGVFNNITGEQPGTCASCHTAGPYLYTPFLSHLKGSTTRFRGVLVKNPDLYVYPGYDGKRLQVKTTHGPAEFLDEKPLKTGKAVDEFHRLLMTRSFELTGQVVTSHVTLQNQASVTGCMECHFIGRGETSLFYLKRLSVNATGTIRGATDDRPYSTDFKDRVDRLFMDHYDDEISQQLQSVFPWAMWMPGTSSVLAVFGRRVKSPGEWRELYVESKVMLELCADQPDLCKFKSFGTGGTRLPKDF